MYAITTTDTSTGKSYTGTHESVLQYLHAEGMSQTVTLSAEYEGDWLQFSLDMDTDTLNIMRENLEVVRTFDIKVVKCPEITRKYAGSGDIPTVASYTDQMVLFAQHISGLNWPNCTISNEYGDIYIGGVDGDVEAATPEDMKCFLLVDRDGNHPNPLVVQPVSSLVHDASNWLVLEAFI